MLAKSLTVLGLSVVATTLAVVAAALVMVVAPLITGVTLAWTFDVASSPWWPAMVPSWSWRASRGPWRCCAAARSAFLLVWPVAMLVGSISTPQRAPWLSWPSILPELLPDAAVVGPLAVVVAAWCGSSPRTVGTLRLLRDDL